MTSWEHIRSQSLFGVTTNWITFYQAVQLPGCRQEIHFPLVQSDSASSPSRFLTTLVLFCPGKDVAEKSVAALYVGHPCVFEALQKSGMVGETIY